MWSWIKIQNLFYGIYFAFLNSLLSYQIPFFSNFHCILCSKNTKSKQTNKKLSIDPSVIRVFFCVLWPSNASSPGNGFQVFVIELFLLNTQMKRPLRSLFIPHSLPHAHRLDLFLLCLSENCVKSYYPI